MTNSEASAPRTPGSYPQRWHLAQYNIAWLISPLDSAEMADFHAALDPINKLAEDTPGFVWRHQNADGNSTGTRIRDDARILINYSVWEDADSLFAYAFRTAHADVYRRRREWFTRMAESHLVLWWLPAGEIPSVGEAERRLALLRAEGPTPDAFTFKRRFGPPPVPDGANPVVDDRDACPA